MANVYRTPGDRQHDFCGILDHTRKLAWCMCYTFAPCISGPVMRYVHYLLQRFGFSYCLSSSLFTFCVIRSACLSLFVRFSFLSHTLRKKYAIEGSVLTDVGAHCPCTYCMALTQETREINSREDTANFKTEVCDCVVCLAMLAANLACIFG
jgi:Cys-rich protein (TIGR01571 family)